MNTSKRKKHNNWSFTVKADPTALKINNIHEYLKEVKRGVGTPKPKKGKGSYRRNPKHKDIWDSY